MKSFVRRSHCQQLLQYCMVGTSWYVGVSELSMRCQVVIPGNSIIARFYVRVFHVS